MPLLGARVGVAGAVVAAGRDWTLPVLGRGDILGNILGNQSGFVAEGVTSLDNVAYRLQRRSSPATL